MLKGVLIKESLHEEKIPFEELAIFKAEMVEVTNAAPDQPSTWTLYHFAIDEDDASRFAEALSTALLPGKWYVDFKSEKEVYVVFAGKIFHYQRGDEAGKHAAIEYGRSLGIPESQLDW